MSEKLHPDLVEPLPARVQALPVHRGFPVPWFVAWVGGEPEFRAFDPEKFVKSVREKRCWVCGETLGRYLTWVAGPMCGLNRTSAEPPCHAECARWSARNCPFLSKPQAKRRDNNLPDGTTPAAGLALMRNPGVTMLWTARSYEIFRAPGGVLLSMGEPTALEWWALGQPATRAQVAASVESGLPSLMGLAVTEKGAVEELLRRKAWLESQYPKE